MRLLCLLAALALILALLVVAHHTPLHVQHPAAAFRNAACICPLCIVTDGLIEVSVAEYC